MCPTCEDTMQSIGHLIYWCPRCGTVSVRNGASYVPAIIGRCRMFAKEAGMSTQTAQVWKQFGLDEIQTRERKE